MTDATPKRHANVSAKEMEEGSARASRDVAEWKASMLSNELRILEAETPPYHSIDKIGLRDFRLMQREEYARCRRMLIYYGGDAPHIDAVILEVGQIVQTTKKRKRRLNKKLKKLYFRND